MRSRDERIGACRFRLPRFAVEVALRVTMSRVLMSYLLSILIAGCVSHDEVARSKSPDGFLEAVLVESNGGATTSLWYDIYVVKAGAKYSGASAAHLYDAVRNPSAYGVNLKWLSPNDIAIEYLSAEQTTVEHPIVQVAGKSITVTLRAGVEDSAARAGGMLYNLNRRPNDRLLPGVQPEAR